jgi:putative transposon-encoded protein
MREVSGIKDGKFVLKDGKVELIYEKTITPYGNGAKVDSQKKYIGKRAYVVVIKN